MNFDDFKGHIYLIDDDPSIRRSLAFSLSSLRYSIQSFENPAAFLRDALPITPAVILLDVRMPDANGLDLQAELCRAGRETPIIFISGESQASEIIQALKTGASDFLLKPFGLHALVQAIDLALQKDKDQLKKRIQAKQLQDRLMSLTDKEREICSWMVKGYGNKEIANINGTAASTVKLHRSRVLEKMNCASLSELLETTMGGSLSVLELLQALPPSKATNFGSEPIPTEPRVSP
jgi:two-component system, LuxR family, response regulator FixJ